MQIKLTTCLVKLCLYITNYNHSNLVSYQEKMYYRNDSVVQLGPMLPSRHL